MFNSTHTLAGFALAESGLKRWSPYATWTAVIAANLPDIDIVTQVAGTASYIEHHRGITHAAVSIPLLSLLLAAVMYKISQNRGRNDVPLQKHFAVAFIAMATHPLLDWTNTYGVLPFLPFDRTWFYGDTLFIIEPYLDLILLAGILLSRRRKNPRLALVAVLAAFGYIGIRVESREIARRQLAQFSRDMPGITSTFVQPDMLNPFVWSGFVETASDLSRVFMHLGSGSSERVVHIRKDPESKVLAAARETRTGKVFRGFARVPFHRIEETPDGFRVLLVDFRFYRLGNREATGLAAEVVLDRSLAVTRESMSFVSALPVIASTP